MRKWFYFVAVAALSACDSNSDKSEDTITVSSPPSPSVRPLIAEPQKEYHRYDLNEGFDYHCISDVSEEDKKQGKALGSVSTYRFLGVQNGKYVLANVDSKGNILLRNSCTKPCVIITDGNGEKLPFSPDSVIGAAFEDALAGRMKEYIPREIRSSDVIPAKFRGAWTTAGNDCASEENIERMEVAAKSMHFYESVADFQRVTPDGASSVLIDALSEGEGQSWKDKLRLTLSDSNNELIVRFDGRGTSKYVRCPA